MSMDLTTKVPDASIEALIKACDEVPQLWMTGDDEEVPPYAAAIASPVLAELFADEDALVDVITAAWVEDGYPDAEDMGPVALVAVQALARRFGARKEQET